jgi:hypothetical protein
MLALDFAGTHQNRPDRPKIGTQHPAEPAPDHPLKKSRKSNF